MAHPAQTQPHATLPLSDIHREVLEDCAKQSPIMERLFEEKDIELRLESGQGSRVKLAALIVSDAARASLPGCGAMVMGSLCRSCETRGLAIELLAKPLPKAHVPGTTPSFIPLDKLVGFYAKHGFDHIPSHASATSAKMLRIPANPKH